MDREIFSSEGQKTLVDKWQTILRRCSLTLMFIYLLYITTVDDLEPIYVESISECHDIIVCHLSRQCDGTMFQRVMQLN